MTDERTILRGSSSYKASGAFGQLTCPVCGVTCNKGQRKQVYCSPACSQVAQRRPIKAMHKRTCPQCLKDFETPVKSVRLCGVACQKLYSAAVWNFYPRKHRAKALKERHAIWKTRHA